METDTMKMELKIHKTRHDALTKQGIAVYDVLETVIRVLDKELTDFIYSKERRGSRNYNNKQDAQEQTGDRNNGSNY